MEKHNSFVKAGALLVVSGFAVKLLSAAYRIPLTRMLGATAMGRYSSILSLFMPFFAFATAGIIPCVSRFTAALPTERTGRMERRVTSFYLPVACVMAVLFVLFGGFYAQYMQDSIFLYGAVILSPAIVFGTVENIYKGITQGKMNMNATAVANVMEGIFKTALGLGGVYVIKHILFTTDSDSAVAVCLVSVTLSGAVCAVYLFLSGRDRRKGEQKGEIPTARQLLSMSVPISASALTVSLTGFFDTAVCLPVIKNLPYTQIVRSYSNASFMSAGEISIYLYGIYQGMVLTLFNLVPALTSPVATACLPALAKSRATGNSARFDRHINLLLWVVGALSIPAAVFIFCYSGDIVTFLFGTTEAQTVVADSLLSIAMPFCVLCCFTAAFNAILNACGCPQTVLTILVFALVTRCAVNWLLCGVPSVNIRAFAISAGVYHLLIFSLSAAAIIRKGIRLPILKSVFLPLTASVAIAAAMKLWGRVIYHSLPLFLRLGCCGVIFVLSYLLILLLSGFVVDIRTEK